MRALTAPEWSVTMTGDHGMMMRTMMVILCHQAYFNLHKTNSTEIATPDNKLLQATHLNIHSQWDKKSRIEMVSLCVDGSPPGYWPLISREWSRDLDTGCWLVHSGNNPGNPRLDNGGDRSEVISSYIPCNLLPATQALSWPSKHPMVCWLLN